MEGKPKLTKPEEDALASLVAYDKSKGGGIVFACASRGESDVSPLERPETILASLPSEYILAWEQMGYVTLSQRRSGFGPFAYDQTTLVLTQDAIAYTARAEKPRFIRWSMNTWDAWATDRRALVTAVIGTVFGAVITTLVLVYLARSCSVTLP